MTSQLLLMASETLALSDITNPFTEEPLNGTALSICLYGPHHPTQRFSTCGLPRHCIEESQH